MPYAINQVMPSESALQWAQTANQQAAADTARAELDQGLIPLRADLLRAQATNTGAQTEYHRAQTVGQGLLNEEARIKAEMLARERDAGLETARRLQALNSQAPQGQNTTATAAPEAPAQTLVAPYSPSPTGAAPDQRIVPQAPANPDAVVEVVAPASHSADDTISRHLVQNSALGGMDNFFSDKAIGIRMQTLLEKGVPMPRAMDIVNSTITQRNKFLEDHAKLRNDLATGDKTAEEVAAKRLEMKREHAYEVYQMTKPTLPDGSANAAYDPSKAVALGQAYGFKSPAEVANFAQQSPRFNEQQKVGVDTFNAISQDRRRADETRLEQQRIGVQRSELAVHQGQLTLNQQREAHLIAQDAYSSARIVDRANMVKEDVGTLLQAVKGGTLSQGLGGAVYVGIEGLAPGVKANVMKYFGNDITGGKLQVTEAMMKRLEAGLTEVEVADMQMSGQKGVAASDKRMELAKEALTGRLSLLSNKDAVVNGLEYALKYTDNIINSQSKRMSTANSALEKVGKGYFPKASTSYEPKAAEATVSTPTIGANGEGYDKVKPGSPYIGPDGQTYTKGGK